MIQVTKLYVGVADNPDGEGIVAALMDGTWLPIFGSNRNDHMLEALKAQLRKCLKATGHSGRMLEFTCREVLEEVPLEQT
jgi:hypothetical protein